MSYISIDSISKSYNEHVALKDLSFSIPEGSIYGLLGPNGAGKTTLIRIINQIIEADSGTVTIGNEKLNANHINVIGYLPEERGLYKKMKVSEQLLFMGQLRGMSRKDCVASIKEWTERLEISDWLKAKVQDLSKGMAQKIQFIATVLNSPKVIILDEPFSGFDPVNANLIKDEILRLRENGSTILFSTHRMESVEELCDYLTLIHNSTGLENGSKREIKKKYSNDTYELVYSGSLQPSTGYELISTGKDEDERDVAIIRLTEGTDANDLLRSLIDQVKIVSFIEKIPSINEIFISLTSDHNE